ncbi:NAD(P)/FAD-dependent oxidoreductase [Nafulsella turpanensis]|uniref:NAD(P)/FAD-dependent oxidoreductase n=1 Tax=Nafulsella turpanensis TaxID=1265690 RepID=UPI0003496F0E|nr:NAD(P)/FAD-dependent oxidoreductase [Nafulsella turpanensis]
MAPVKEHQEISIQIPKTDKPRVVIIGGGFAGLRIIKKLEKENLQVIMLDRHNYHTFQPLLYQVATAGLEPGSIAGPLRQVMEEKEDFHFRMAKVTRINHEKKTVSTPLGELSYDYLIIACGTKTNYFGNDDKFKEALPLKQLPHALNLRSHILQNFEKAVNTSDPEELKSLMNVVVVGGGPTGVEVSGALGELKNHVLPKDYPELDFRQMKIYLVEGLPHLLNGMSKTASKKANKYLKDFDVNIKLNAMVDSYDGKEVKLSTGEVLNSQTLIWAAGVKGNTIPGLPEECVKKSQYLVDEFNQVQGVKDVFAVGDVALMETRKTPKGYPMLAPVAIQQGENLAENLLRIIRGEKNLQPFRFFNKGSMATVGRNRAVVDMPNGLSFGGFAAWTTWMFVHLLYLIGFRNKLVVFNNWVWNYFTYDRGIRLIIRPFDKEEKIKQQESEQ